MKNTEQRNQQFELRKSVYNNTWQIELKEACFKDPGYCCIALWCPCCVSYSLRKKALYNDMSRYVCCAGHCPCSGRMGESSCPEFCLVNEVVWCFPQSVASTRWMLQDEMRIANTQCDNCIIGTMIALQYLSCLFSIAACITGNDALIELANILDCLADCAYVSVCACMQTQAHSQIKARDEQKVSVQAPHQAPMPQAIHTGMPQQGAYPPGAPAPGAYPPGAPAPGAYPPAGYPPAGYPPSIPQGYPGPAPGPYPGAPPAQYPPMSK